MSFEGRNRHDEQGVAGVFTRRCRIPVAIGVHPDDDLLVVTNGTILEQRKG
jgi:hypothetical protein